MSNEVVYENTLSPVYTPFSGFSSNEFDIGKLMAQTCILNLEPLDSLPRLCHNIIVPAVT